MKKLLGILVMSVLVSTNAYSMSEDQLIKLASKAETRKGTNLIIDYCEDEDAVFLKGAGVKL